MNWWWLTPAIVLILGVIWVYTGRPIKHKPPDEVDVWTPTLAEIHQQQHEAWEEEYRNALPPNERPMSMEELLQKKEILEFQYAIRDITPREYIRRRSQLDAEAAKSFKEL